MFSATVALAILVMIWSLALISTNLTSLDKGGGVG